MTHKKDNSTFWLKAQLRNQALRELTRPVVLETHGGVGKLYARCYASVQDGVVFEQDPYKSAQLGRQRPGWAVYEADCITAMSAGVGGHLPVNFVDFDPWGGPWLAMDAFFSGLNPTVPKLVFVVNDGLPQRLKMHVAWSTEGLEDAVQHFGNAAIYENYLEVCKWLVKRKAAGAGYALRRWTAYLCGFNHHMAHYAAVMERA